MRKVMLLVVAAMIIASMAGCNLFYESQVATSSAGANLDGSVLDNVVEVSVAVSSPATEMADFGTVILNSMYTSEIADFKVSLTSPAGTEVTLFSWEGYGVMDGTYTFGSDFYTAEGEDPVPSVIDWNSDSDRDDRNGGTFEAEGNLMNFVGEDPNGDWVLTITETSGNSMDDFSIDSFSFDFYYE